MHTPKQGEDWQGRVWALHKRKLHKHKKNQAGEDMHTPTSHTPSAYGWHTRRALQGPLRLSLGGQQAVAGRAIEKEAWMEHVPKQ